MAAFSPSQDSLTGSQMEHSGSQGLEVKIEASAQNEPAATLLVRHLPEGIRYDTLSRLFSHYGAYSVRPCSGGRLRNCAFIDFKNDALAYQALRQLNGVRFLGKVLKVEKANKINEDHRSKQSENQGRKHNILPIPSARDTHTSGTDISGELKSGAFIASQPIAPKLGVDYPFPAHLGYAYPPPDGNILTNIVNALIAVPRFYTQVLHLMNKMNIPAPFRMALPTPPLPPSESAPAPPPLVEAYHQSADVSSSESELESSDKDVDDKASSLGPVVKSGRKRRREAIVGPAFDKQVAHETVGLKLATLLPKEIPIVKKKNSMLQIKIAPKEVQSEEKGSSIEAESVEPEPQTPNDKAYAAPEEIQSNKLVPEEILSLPKFKNYTVGHPATVLYIKNLAKDVVADDFSYVFGSLFGSTDAAKNALNVKLMQDGRMRGQAFVTFPSVELAHQALNLVNGYMFKGKPMIVQFGRNPSASSKPD
ncbi:unnamed protein product [Linum tenue]|uniref:RRM domain-containing protein n=1 Tax=Linum tenue TaxID=586396 RepID=A0AAV0LES8_9ROSI|nr:unnamed protein product [Linum tenue]